MRRSAAPSQKLKNQINTQDNLRSIYEPANKIHKSSNILKVSNGNRQTSDVLNLLLSTNQIENEQNEHNNATTFSSILSTEDTKTKVEEKCKCEHDHIYNICWGKKSAKKHKTWEGDGIMYVKNGHATVKDVDGNYLGQVSKLKSRNFEFGEVISLGSKEIQIVEECNHCECLNKPVMQLIHDSPPRKKFKNSSFSSVKYDMSGGKVIRRGIEKLKFINSDYFTFPEPKTEHQWKYNTDKLPVTDVKLDPVLYRILRSHQIEGAAFLYKCVMGFWNFQYRGAILADEMGLGKTLQCITLTWAMIKCGPYGGIPIIRNMLIVTPSSLTENWRKEYLKWLGRERIKVFVVDSKNKVNDYMKLIRTVPILIISYEMFIRYYEDIKKIEFNMLICDEGHRLKNQNIKATQLLNQLSANMRIILTGTPIQNDLLEFYTLVNFVNPGVLGDYSYYRKYYEQPIVASRQPEADPETKELGESRAKELNKLSGNFILRRTKEIINKFLPTKTEYVIFLKMTILQKTMYTSQLDKWFENQGLSALTTITKLKKICNHPALATGLTDELKEESVKFMVILAIIGECQRSKERIVLCSSYTQTLDLLEELCVKRGFKHVRLDGSVPVGQRMKTVDQFNQVNSDNFVFLLSAKAGGVGLNLVGASRLVLVDSDWNPATDLQAMARIWRDGQKKSVFLYRLLSTGTIEEKIYQRQLSKIGLGSSVVDADSSDTLRLSDEDLKDLFSSLEEDCSTHNLLNCDCSGTGDIPGICRGKASSDTTDESNNRSCQLGANHLEGKQNQKGAELRVDQLMLWEHHRGCAHLDHDTLQNIGLADVSEHITFMFVNKSFSDTV